MIIIVCRVMNYAFLEVETSDMMTIPNNSYR